MYFSDDHIKENIQQYLDTSYSDLITKARDYLSRMILESKDLGMPEQEYLYNLFISLIIALKADRKLSIKEKQFLKDISDITQFSDNTIAFIEEFEPDSECEASLINIFKKLSDDLKDCVLNTISIILAIDGNLEESELRLLSKLLNAQ